MGRSIVFLAILIFFSNKSFAQERLSISVDSLHFDELLDYLRSEYHMDFSYDSDLDVEGIFSLDHEAGDIEDLLAPLWSMASLDCHFVSEDHVLLRTRSISVQSVQYRFVIKDEKTKAPLELVAISADNGVGTYSDWTGAASLFFKSDHPAQNVSLHLLGYESIALPLTAQRTMEVELSPIDMDIDEVVITGRIPPVQYLSDGGITMRDDDQVDLISSVGEPDVLRSLHLLPGISAHTDRSAGIQIRGGEVDQTLIMLDNMPLYNPYHYYGIYSAINDGYVDQVSVFKNTVPAEYGSASNGMVLMSSDLPKEVLSGEVNLSTLSSSVVVETRLGDLLSMQVSGRTSLHNIYDDNNQNQQDILSRSRGSLLRSNPDFSFYDWNGKVTLTPSKGHDIELSIYQSNDQLIDEYQYVQRPSGRRLLSLEENYSNSEQWNNLSYSLSYHGQLTDRFSWISTYHNSEYSNDNLRSLKINTELRNSRRENTLLYSQRNDVSDRAIKSMLSYEIIDGNLTLSAGGQYSQYGADLTLSRTNRPDDLLVEETAKVLSAYSDMHLMRWHGWDANVGVRLDHLSTTSEVYFSPRFTFTKRTSENFLIKGSLSQQFQFLREFQIENANGRTLSVWSIADQRRIPVIKVAHVMAGFRYSDRGWSLDVEGYINDTDGVLEYAFISAPVNSQQQLMPNNSFRLYKGQGRTMGIDMLLRYTGGAYSSWLSYTLSKSTHSFKQVARAADFPSQLDRRHQLKWINSYRAGAWTLSTSLIYSSGRPYTDITKLRDSQSREDLSPGDRISRLPTYIRQDIGVQYSFDIKGYELALGLSIFNLWDRANVDYIQYIYSVDGESIGRQNRPNVVIGTETPLLGRTLSVQANFKF